MVLLMNSGLNAFALTLILLAGGLSGCLQAFEDVIDEIEDLEEDYPSLDLGERSRSSPALIQYDACDNLLQDLRDAAFEESLVSLDQNAYWHWTDSYFYRSDDMMEMDGAVAEGVAFDDAGSDSTSAPSVGGSEANSGSSDPVQGTDFSGTNNQEQGVDEADFLKTDGRWIYVLNNGKLVVLGVPEFGQLEMMSNMSVEGSPMQMLIDEERLVIVSSVYFWNLQSDDPLREILAQDEPDEWGYYGYRISNLIKYTVVDISNRSAPEVEREIYIEGNYHTARLVNGTVRSVTHADTYITGLLTYPELPSNYWEVDDRYERMDLWNRSVTKAINNNRELVDGLTLEDFAPRIHEKTNGVVSTHAVTAGDCSEFSSTEDVLTRGFTTIATIGLFEEDTTLQVDHITSSWVNVYASGNMMVLAEPANDWWWYWGTDESFEDETNIHAFDISEPANTEYIGSGRVKGDVQDQFSISEFNGSIRVASTSDNWGRWWMATVDVMEDIAIAVDSVLTGESDELVIETEIPECLGPSNHVTVLQDDGEGNLNVVGELNDIACGERIWSSRFMGEIGYLVTFQNIDPLWTIDLSDPTSPSIIGELEVPGVSTYIHPLNEDLLLTIGIGPAGADGFGLDWSQTQISLFDVTDLENPTLADSLSLSPGYVDENCANVNSCGWSWSWSEATYEHKAFNYWEPENLLAVPLSTHRWVYDTIVEDERTYTYYGYEFVSMLKLVNIDIENKSLSTHGEVDHSSLYGDGVQEYWYSNTDIRRSIFMGDYVYALSSAGMTVHLTDNLSHIVTVDLPEEDPVVYHYQNSGTSSSDGGASPEPVAEGESSES
jgi:uncharacterized secreted protein with C-terminal beta-propeller domain